ncbi:MAG TPA: type IV pilus secretin PilQ [Thermoanaerobaculia bacterium]|nr:type IV pilus secretin PilQ [Thermoanaerobaculia bacterium]
MSRGNRILLITTVLLVTANGLSAGLWSRRSKPAAASPAAEAMTLTAVEIDGSSVVLRTSGTPAYTSYSPAPDVFVVDLTGTTRPADLSIPATLPQAVTSIAAEEAIEMGSRLTRVTIRLAGKAALQVSASDNAVIISMPGQSIAEAPAMPAPVEAAVVELAEPRPMTVSEPPVATEVIAVFEPPPAHPAKSVKRVFTRGEGTALEVQIAGDGALSHKAFRLDNPARLVIDIPGRNAVPRPAVEVSNDLVQRVRIAQFKGGAEPVTRVVVDLSRKSEFTVTPDGSTLRVTFGTNLPMPSMTTITTPAPVTTPRPEEPRVTATPPPPMPAATIAEIPAVVEEATWKVPVTSEPYGARQVINNALDQAPPDTSRRRLTASEATGQTMENVFEDAPPQPTTIGGRTLSATQRVFTGDPISLNLKDADIKDVLRTFAELTGLNIAVDPQVSGSVTVDFVDVPWDQALDIILRQNGLTFILEGNVMRVGTIERLAAETAASRRLAEEERLNVPLTTIGFKLSYARATEVSALLKDLASPRARIIVDARTNQLIISEVPQYLQTMRNLIETVDIPNRQVSIEARIVETTKTFTLAYGFSWGFNALLDPALGTGTGLIFPNRIGFTGGPFDFTGGSNPILGISLRDVLGTFDLDLTLAAAETENLVRVISAPKITTQDNTQAEIQSGVQIPYQTRVNFTTTVAYIDATLRLAVTPQITEAGTIIMDIAVQKVTPGEPIPDAAGTPLNTRQARTRVMVRDGGTAVIGGIYQASDTEAQGRVPVLHQIPILGALFRSNSSRTQHDELLIFITPRIVRGS